MKRLPTVISSPARGISVELLGFDGAHPIPNRDAVGYYFDVRLNPSGAPSRLAVLFSGTVMAVRPDAFGLPIAGDREQSFRTFAEAAIGDLLDEHGLPPFTPSGVPAATIECFTPHFQTWRDREPATDDLIEQYLAAHVLSAWTFTHAAWTLGPSDYLRLHQPLNQVLRLVRLHEGEDWTVAKLSSTGATLTATPAFLRSQQVTKRAPSTEAAPEAPALLPEQSAAQFVYVDETRIADLRRIDATNFDLRKLIALCEELNQCYRAQCYHAVAALTRAVMDHIPPIFGQRTFSEVANNYGGTRSFKDCVRRLDEAARKIADAHLHTSVRASEILPTRVQINFSNEVDVLLAEVIRILQPAGAV